MRKSSFTIVGVIVLYMILWLNRAHAAVIYVDKDESCPGSGTSERPYCTIQRAFDVVRPGSIVRIRNSTTPYDERAVGSNSGTSSAPITVEPDTGHRPILTYSGRNAQAGAIEIRDADYWHIRGLTFDGSGRQTSRYAVLLYALSRDITGHQIAHNTFRYWGGTGENTNGAAAVNLRPSFSKRFNNLYVTNSMISNNVFEYNAHEAIRLTKTRNITVGHNNIRHVRCGRKSDGRAGATGIKDSQDSVGNVIQNNIVHDHQRSEDCLLPNQGFATYAGIYCDTGPTGGQVTGNTVYNIDQGVRGNRNPSATGLGSVGIYLESRCQDWRVHGNLVYNIGRFGLRNGSRSTGAANRNSWTNNTVYGVGTTALLVATGRNVTVKNNILVHNNANAAIEVTATAVENGPHIINHNLYWDMQDGTKVGRWGDDATHDLATWRRSCGCDEVALSLNPLFMNTSAGSEDFRLGESSPARTAGEGGRELGASPSALTR
jgi:hypothetical protein